ncbi:MAG: hypothetical protein A2Y17_03125 [Clostridiales bacterium GWF2_38_85]|nr:MAG: hypothetical protein A2Y17_03125 [Clostridiales bacterium GWF2_38_85]
MNRNYLNYILKFSFIVLFLILSYSIIWAASNNLLPFFNYSEVETSKEIIEATSSYPEATSSPETSTPPIIIDFSTYLINIKNKENYPAYQTTDFPYDNNSIFAFAKSEIINLKIVSMVPRMGYIFVTYDDNSISLLDNTGNVIFDKIPDGYTFAGVRDIENRPLFLFEDKYYYLDINNIFTLSEYDEGRNGRGIQFDYPSYYGESNSIIEKYKYGNFYGLRYIKSKAVYLSAYYKAIYSYSEGICSAIYSNYYGQDRLFFYNEKRQSVSKEYLPPLTNGIESLGYYYFDHGLTRIRTEENGVSKELLMYKDTTLFQLPPDFELVSYNNGVLILKKGNKYGYMKYTGEWLTDPVYKYAGPFIEGVAVVSQGSKYGLIDINGNTILPEVFDFISSCSGGVVIMHEEENGYYILNKMHPIPVEPNTSEESIQE